MFLQKSVFFIVAKTFEDNLDVLPADEWVDAIHTVEHSKEYCSAIRKDELFIHSSIDES